MICAGEFTPISSVAGGVELELICVGVGFGLVGSAGCVRLLSDARLLPGAAWLLQWLPWVS